MLFKKLNLLRDGSGRDNRELITNHHIDSFFHHGGISLWLKKYPTEANAFPFLCVATATIDQWRVETMDIEMETIELETFSNSDIAVLISL